MGKVPSLRLFVEIVSRSVNRSDNRSYSLITQPIAAEPAQEGNHLVSR